MKNRLREELFDILRSAIDAHDIPTVLTVEQERRAAHLVRAGALAGRINWALPFTSRPLTPLAFCTRVSTGSTVLIEALLDAGADPNVFRGEHASREQRDGPGLKPLKVGQRRDGTRILRLLLARGADATLVDEDGVGPLLGVRDPESARLLIEAGANPLQQTSVGETPLGLAERAVANAKTPAERRDAKAVLELLREAAKKWEATLAGRTLQIMAGEKRIDPRRERGMLRFVRWVRKIAGEEIWDLLAVRGDAGAVAGALAKVRRGSRWEKDVADRLVKARQFIAVVQLVGQKWSLVVYNVAGYKTLLTEKVLADARALSKRFEVVSLLSLAAGRWQRGRVVERVNAVGEIFRMPKPHELESPRVLDARLDEYVKDLDLLVPLLGLGTDGAHAKVQVWGLRPADIARIDLVVTK